MVYEHQHAMEQEHEASRQLKLKLKAQSDHFQRINRSLELQEATNTQISADLHIKTEALEENTRLLTETEEEKQRLVEEVQQLTVRLQGMAEQIVGLESAAETQLNELHSLYRSSELGVALLILMTWV